MKQPTSLESNIAGIFVARTIGAWALLSGLLIFAGGKKHWSSHVYDTLNYMPGSPYTWAAIISLAGILIIVGSLFKLHIGKYTIRNMGLRLVALWCFILVIGFVSVLNDSTLSFNIPTIYLLVGVLSIFTTKSRFEP